MTEEVVGCQVMIKLEGRDAWTKLRRLTHFALSMRLELEVRPLFEDVCQELQDLVDAGLIKRHPDGVYRITELGLRLSKDEVKVLFDRLDDASDTEH